MKTTMGEGERLRRAISQRTDKRRKLDAELRAQASSYARRRAAEGAGASAIASELGVSIPTVSRWLRARKSAALVPVHVIAEPIASSSSFEVVTPRGLRVVGLDIDALCTLLARHG